MASAHVDPALFGSTAFDVAPQTVDCTLENGDAAQCTKITVGYKPSDLGIGPFCPATLDDAGGLWNWDGQKDGLYRIDATLLKSLAEAGYKMYDDQGNVFTFDIWVEGPSEDHSCIAASLDETVTMTILIPANPVMAATPTPLGTVAKVGLALDGVPIFADAPAVADTGHMPALDLCGGHVDPGGWFHWHATASDIDTVLEGYDVAAGCTSVPQSSDAMFAYAFDGYAIYGSTDAGGVVPTDLDACNGHMGLTDQSETPVYHYHARTTFPNLPPCLTGVVAQDNFSTTAAQGIGSAGGGGGPGPGQGGMPPGFDEAAATLGVTPEALMSAVRDAGGPQLDMAKAAATLGITEEALREALPPRP